MCVFSFYLIPTEPVLNGIGFGFIKKKLLGSLISHLTYFVK